MSRFLVTTLMLLMPFLVKSQGDMLLLKKNNKVIKSYFPGSLIRMNVGNGYQEFYINKLADDSLFLYQYQITPYVDNLGFPRNDTTGTVAYVFHYQDIETLYDQKQGNWSWQGTGAALFGGGTVLTVAGLLTWVFAEKNTQYYARPGFVAASAVAAGVGYLLLQTHSGKKWRIGKKFTLQYINTK